MQPEAHGERIPTLDGWRTVAFAAVLLSHGFVGLAWDNDDSPRWLLEVLDRLGSAGVMVFFAISGFLICTRLLRARSRLSKSETLRSFYIRRVFRIQPPALVYLGFLLLAYPAGLYGRWLLGDFVWRDWFGALLGVRNYFGQMQGTNHFWSLAIEEQFYLVWPLLLILLGSRVAAWLACAGVLVTPAIRWLEISRWHDQPLYAILQRTECRADSLLLPCLLAILLANEKRRKQLSFLFAPWMGAAVIVAMALLIAASYRYAALSLWQRQLTPALLALLVIGTTGNRGWLARVLEWKPLAAIGRVTYSLYLWQQIIVYRPFTGTTFRQVSAEMAVRLLILAAVALASYYFVETPLIRVGRRLTRSRSAASDPLAVAA